MEHADAGQLDNPTWFSLITRQRHLAKSNELAARYDPEIAPFAAIKSSTPEALIKLGELIAPGESVLVQTSTGLPSVDGLHSDMLFTALQMTDHALLPPQDESDVHRLNAGDIGEMVELARKTNPGPFASRAIETGNYIGLRAHGRLIAMAGERMNLDGFVEISAVCVDDDHRGKGLAGRLMNILRHEIKERDDTPFLHVREDNVSAIALYRRLGFEARKVFPLYRVTRNA